MFYFARQNLFESLGMIEIVGHTEVTGAYDWISGERFEKPMARETLLLDPAYGTNMPDFFDTTIPVMSRHLIDGLRAAGVDSFDEYPVVLKRIDDGTTHIDYAAVNFLGCVDAVDRSQSVHRLRFGKPHFTGAITIDPAEAGEARAFRLMYGPGLLVVNEAVAASLRAGSYAALMLQPTTEYSGT